MGKKQPSPRKARSSKKGAAAPETPVLEPVGVAEAPAPPRSAYLVLARRYRPQQFHEVVGQEAAAQALAGAIAAGRVAHAYLFTGSRGVGKTSMARILAKALNCVEGPPAQPCGRCDICRSIASGEDVDVLEIDGASNRGIDEIRELRQNVQFRPGRARYKIYIIDEVHMLTRDAFNALLKTLEEPPAHVKFIFCTTEAQRIPITILSRCQRFDFPAIAPEAIVERLRQIVEAEQVDADPDALETLARRAAGSMRDSQSLLDQLLAFGGNKLTAAQVHQMLGTAREDRIVEFGRQLLGGDPGAALAALEVATAEGVQVEQLIDQLIELFRDLLVLRCAGPAARLASVSSRWREQLHEQARSRPLENLIAATQILVEAKGRMRGSSYARTLAELALVRVTSLEDLQAVSALLEGLRRPPLAGGDAAARSPRLTVPTRSLPTGANPAPAPAQPPPRDSSRYAQAMPSPRLAPPERPSAPAGPLAAQCSLTSPFGGSSETETAPPRLPRLDPRGGTDPLPSLKPDDMPPPPASSEPRPLRDEELPALWQAALARCGGMLAEQAARAEFFRLEDDRNATPARMAVRFSKQYNFPSEYCARPEHLIRLEAALSEVAGQPLRIRVQCQEGAPASAAEPGSRSGYKQRLAQSVQEPLVRKAAELLQAAVVRVEDVPSGARAEGS